MKPEFPARARAARPERPRASRPTRTPRVAHVATADLAIRYLLRNQLRRMAAAGYEVHAASAPGRHAAELSSDVFTWTALPMARRIHPASDACAYRRMVRYFRAVAPDVVHTHTNKAGILGCWAGRAAGAPVVVTTVHGFYFHEHMQPAVRSLFVRLYRETFRHVDRVFVQSAEDVRTAEREGIVPPEKLVHIGNGIDLARFDPSRAGLAEDAAAKRAELGIAPDALVVGIVARVNGEKGFGELLPAVAAARERLTRPVHLVVVGDGPARARWERRAHELGVADVTHWVGERDDIPEWMRAFDVYALPSWREGFPRTLCEAFAMGRACVATRIRGCRELIRDGHTGLLVPRRDARALADALVALLGNAERRAALGHAAREHALAHLDESRVLERILAEYAALGFPPPIASATRHVPESRHDAPTPPSGVPAAVASESKGVPA